ncbi:MAG: hypothetical protein HKN26_15355 [Acidimicrobiales bacterium]|nr:hypothetical protein [Acidimicrobiales bacterium]
MTASMNQPGRGIRFPLFGFPTRVDWSFFFIALLFSLRGGSSGSGIDLEYALVWMGILLPSILIHELGHAFAARRLGARPSIVVHGMGGLTSYAPPQPPTRGQSIGVSFAGPAAGFVFGAIILAIALTQDIDLSLSTVSFGEPFDRALALGVWINLAWGGLNLLPILPLDGGHILQELLPGDRVARQRLAAIVSLVVASTAAVLFWVNGWVFAALLIGYFGLQSIAVLNATGRSGNAETLRSQIQDAVQRLQQGDPTALPELERLVHRTADPQLQAHLKTIVVEVYAGSGNRAEARRVLNEAPGNVHPAVYALVSAYEGDPTALDQVREIFARQPAPESARCLMLAYGAYNRGHEVPAIMASSAGGHDPLILAEAEHSARGRGLSGVADQLAAMRKGT